MNNFSRNKITKESPNNNNPKLNDELSELRTLLLGVEPTKLNELYERLDDSQTTAEDISRLLPEAVILRSMQDKQLTEAVIPTVEDAIQSSVKKDLNILADAIFPIIGPATRKAIYTALDEMFQSLDQTLEHSLSPQSFKWRLEARQTGKSFAEVVLLRTMIFRVEQVFLIHNQTGLLLQHIVANQVAAQDPDLVSAMLTAIQDFVKDSFNMQTGDGLQTLEFGDLTIWIEKGPQAVLAGIIRGNAPQELRLVFQEVIEKIHLKLRHELNVYQGETEPFEASKTYLATCLEARYKIRPNKHYNYIWLSLSTIAIALGIWGFSSIKNQVAWAKYFEKLDSQPGIVVIKVEQQNGKYIISGMRDPLAGDPNILMKQANLNPKAVISHWEPYVSLDPELTVKRAEQLLQPPKTVSLKIDENHILSAVGSAPREWILSTGQLWRFIPGITQFKQKDLVILEVAQLELYKKQLEQEMLLFLEGTTDLLPDEDKKLQNLVLKMQKLLEAAKYLDKSVRIQIIGHANTVGSEEQNIRISENRANKILSYFTSQGINRNNFGAVGVSTKQPLQTGLNKQDEKFIPRVSFKVLWSNEKN